MSFWRRPSGFLLAFVLLCLAGLFRSALSGWIGNDESWFLQVSFRIASGDVLYRDIFFGSTPLSAYLAGLSVQFLSPQLLIIKAWGTACFALTLLLTWRISKQFGFGSHFRWVAGLSLWVFSPPHIAGSGSLYTPLSYVFLLASFSLLLEYNMAIRTDSPDVTTSSKWLIYSMIAGALSFASKPTTGIYTIAMLICCILLILTWRQKLRLAGKLGFQLSVVFGAVVLLTVILPISASGGFPKFLEYVFVNKQTYLQVADLSYVNALATIFRLITPPIDLEAAWQICIQLAFLVPPIVLGGLGFLTIKSHSDFRNPLGLLFFLACMGDVFPRVTVEHLACAFPGILVGMGLVLQAFEGGINRQTLKFRITKIGEILLFAWIILGVAYSLISPAKLFFSGEYQFSPHLAMRGVLYPIQTAQAERKAIARLHRNVSDQPVFLLTPQAGYFYLVSGYRNPTPYDYPLVTAFGINGEEEVIQDLETGKLKWVCSIDWGNYYLHPKQLVAYLNDHLQLYKKFDFCNLYTNP